MAECRPKGAAAADHPAGAEGLGDQLVDRPPADEAGRPVANCLPTVSARIIRSKAAEIASS